MPSRNAASAALRPANSGSPRATARAASPSRRAIPRSARGKGSGGGIAAANARAAAPSFEWEERPAKSANAQRLPAAAIADGRAPAPASSARATRLAPRPAAKRASDSLGSGSGPSSSSHPSTSVTRSAGDPGQSVAIVSSSGSLRGQPCGASLSRSRHQASRIWPSNGSLVRATSPPRRASSASSARNAGRSDAGVSASAMRRSGGSAS